MRVFKKVFLFLGSQLRQIKTGGLRIFCRKIKKAVSLLFLSLTAPIAVYLKIDWPKGWDFLINKNFKKIKKFYLEPNADAFLMDQLLEKQICYFKKILTEILIYLVSQIGCEKSCC